MIILSCAMWLTIGWATIKTLYAKTSDRASEWATQGNKITHVINFGAEKVAQSNLQILMFFNRVRKKFSDEKQKLKMKRKKRSKKIFCISIFFPLSSRCLVSINIRIRIHQPQREKEQVIYSWVWWVKETSDKWGVGGIKTANRNCLHKRLIHIFYVRLVFNKWDLLVVHALAGCACVAMENFVGIFFDLFHFISILMINNCCVLDNLTHTASQIVIEGIKWVFTVL